MNQLNTPLYDALLNHIKKRPISLHVPGHKYGRVFPDKGIESYKSILPLDVTELSGLDDLHEPTEVILEAEDLLSSLYESRRSFFLVNGTTVGNLSMVLAVCQQNDLVLVQRNCHKSIMNALVLAGARPIFLSPEFDTDFQVPTYVHEREVIQALEKYPKAKAIILTNPSYYGHTYDLKNIIKSAHDIDVPVLVDEAHGAHFGVGSPFPESSIKCGADIVVQSAHKTLPAMTMGSFLHFQSELVPIEGLTFYLKSLQSSSPSYPIMASLDLARYYLANKKEQGIVRIVQQYEEFREKLSSIPQLSVILSTNREIQQDPLKVTIQSRCRLSGYEIQALLENTGIYTELADPLNVLCVLPLEEIDINMITFKIQQALLGIEPTIMKEDKRYIANEPIQSMNPLSYFELKSMKTAAVHLDESVNKVSAQTIVPYPPGIPLLLQGEIITSKHLEQLEFLGKMGAKFQGGLVNNKINIYEGEKEEKIK
ncbi:aminotransferase class I/II-fold pyridoxal phosphate-dependent enzyme [Bacillus sp. DJP31]|uniref:aminotransferase class I/II-fold pyridoxal phosphate-dependent enzyme n=1 Tax=Bacillus sp. DJP31 TaxID=3409789 RepID=UPI003BB6F06B